MDKAFMLADILEGLLTDEANIRTSPTGELLSKLAAATHEIKSSLNVIDVAEAAQR